MIGAAKHGISELQGKRLAGAGKHVTSGNRGKLVTSQKRGKTCGRRSAGDNMLWMETPTNQVTNGRAGNLGQLHGQKRAKTF